MTKNLLCSISFILGIFFSSSVIAAPVSYVQIATTTRTQSGGFHTATGTVDTFTIGTKSLAANGSNSNPSYSFTNFNTTGWYAESGPGLTASIGGTALLEFLSTGLSPKLDLTYNLGGAGNRFLNTYSSKVIGSTVTAENNTLAFYVGSTDTMDVGGNSWQSNVTFNVAYSVPAGDAQVQITNTDGGATGASTFSSWNGVSGANMASFGASYIGSRMGVSIAGGHEFVCGGTKGCVFGSRGAAPIYLGTNDHTAITISSQTQKQVTFSDDIVATTGTFTGPVIASSANFSGTIVATTATFSGQLIGKGTVTNDSAPSGFIGEVISTSVTTSTSFPSSGAYGDLASKTFTAGDWLMTACIWTIPNGGTISDISWGISTTSGNSSAGLVPGDNQFDSILPPTSTADQGGCLSNYHLQLSAATTVYFKYEADYAVAAPKARGRMNGVRIR